MFIYKNRIINSCRLLLFAAIMRFSLTACSPAEKTVSQDFSCSVNTVSGTVNGYLSDDGRWYIFLPSSENIETVVLNFTGPVISVDNGVLDSEQCAIADVFNKNGDSVNITASDGNIYNVTVMQSTLPSVHISLTGITLEEIHRDKNIRTYRNTLDITDLEKPENNLHLAGNVQLKGRGNSSWREYAKKGYQITLASPVSIMGMASAEKWLLLANSSDDSMLRNAAAFTAASAMDMAFVPSFEYVDLWIDGDYLGTYMLCEKITIETARLNLTHRDGALFEYDQAFWQEEEFSFYNNYIEKYFTLKESVADNDAAAAALIRDFNQSVDSLADYLYSTLSSEITIDSLSQYIDVDSFIKYYLINEYLQNREGFVTSFYWYKDGVDDVLHLGPIWDFDTSMGNNGVLPRDVYAHAHLIFGYLMSSPEFAQRAQQTYEKYKNIFASLPDYVLSVSEKIRSSADMNYVRWNDTLGKKNVKNWRLSFAASFDEAVSNLHSWLSRRRQLFAIPLVRTVSSAFSEDGSTLDVYIQDNGYADVSFTLRHRQADKSLSRFYPAVKDGNLWRAEFDLSFFGSSGTYLIDASSGGHVVATGRNYTHVQPASSYALSAQMAEDNSVIYVSLTDENLCKDVVFTIHNRDVPGSQEVHIQGYRNSSGQWECTIPAELFTVSGTQMIKAYHNDNGAFTLLTAATVEYVDFRDFPVNAAVTPDGTVMTITLQDTVPRDAVIFAVWSTANSQDDIQWIDAVRNADGLWQRDIDMSVFIDGGAYSIHAFEKSNGINGEMLNTATFHHIIRKDSSLYPVKVTVSEDKTAMEICLQTEQPCAGVSFAVWSEASAQADLQWFDARQQGSNWVYTVDLSDYPGSGTFHIHAYEKAEGVLTAMLNTTTADV
ncbi:MAG: CotH kinase family protein [Oscillospiraceae bacterium]|nr:CotH kinase family protein [Oscillospiraceae bacterium]